MFSLQTTTTLKSEFGIVKTNHGLLISLKILPGTKQRGNLLSALESLLLLLTCRRRHLISHTTLGTSDHLSHNKLCWQSKQDVILSWTSRSILWTLDLLSAISQSSLTLPTKNSLLVCCFWSSQNVVSTCFQKMKMHQEEKSILKIRLLKKEPSWTLLKRWKFSLSKVSSGVRLHQLRTLLLDSEKTQIMIEFSLKMMSLIGNPSCGGTTKSVTSNARTVMITSTPRSRTVKPLTPFFL